MRAGAVPIHSPSAWRWMGRELVAGVMVKSRVSMWRMRGARRRSPSQEAANQKGRPSQPGGG